MANKFGARAVEVDGYRFASKAEAGRYEELRMMQLAGEIKSLVPHPRFALYAPIYADQFNRRDDRPPIDSDEAPAKLKLCDGEYGPRCYAKRIGYYTADFTYETKEGKAIVEDVKGGRATSTTAYRLRKRLVEATYGFTVTEILR